MRIKVNGKTVKIPSSLSEITLGQRIDYHNQYGLEFDIRLKAILAMPQGVDREMEEMSFAMDKCLATISFFTGITVQALQASQYVDDLIAIYYGSLRSLLEDEQELAFSDDSLYEWNGELWELAPPTLSYGDKMTFGEFIDSKQIVKGLHSLGKGDYEVLLSLCAIYFRRKGEAYDDSFARADSERIKLMRTLPLNYALLVGFFLTSSMNFWLSTSRSSSLQGYDQPEGQQRSILPGGDG